MNKKHKTKFLLFNRIYQESDFGEYTSLANEAKRICEEKREYIRCYNKYNKRKEDN